MKTLLIHLFIISVILIDAASAEMYQLNVTRKSKNIYTVNAQDMIIQTKYCYEYGYSEEVILNSSGYPKLIFVNNNQSCDIKGLYSKSEQKAGNFQVNVSQEEDDWYEIMGANTFIRTSLCLELALGSRSVLKINSNGYGKLIFDRGNSCTVEGVYSKMRL